MADIYLKVGVDKDYSDFQTGINNLVSEINKTPPKIKISFDTKQAIKDLREQLASINKSLDIGNTNTQIQAYSKNIVNVGNAAKTAAKGVEELIKTTQKYSNSNDTPYITSQTYLNTLNNTLRTETQVRDEVGNIKEELATLTNSYKTQEQLSNELYDKEKQRVTVNKQIATEIDKITSKQRAVAKVGGTDNKYYKQLETYKSSISSLKSQYTQTGDYQSFSVALKDIQTQYTQAKTATDNYIKSKRNAANEERQNITIMKQAISTLDTIRAKQRALSKVDGQGSTYYSDLARYAKNLKVSMTTNSSSGNYAQLNNYLKGNSAELNNLIYKTNEYINSQNKIIQTQNAQKQQANEIYNKENQRAEVNKKIATEIDKITSKQRAVAKVGGTDNKYYKQLESYKTKLSDLQNQYKKTGDYNSFTVALKEVQTQYKKTKTAADNYIASKKQETQESAKTVAQENAKVSATKKYNSILAQCESALRNYTSAQSSSNASSRTAYNDIKSATSSLKSQYSQLQAGKISEKQFGQAVENTNNILRSNTNIIKSNGDATKTFLDRVGGLASKFTSWLTISQVIMYAVRAVRNMITESINLDTAMTELKKVTDETDETYSEFLDNAAERAKKLGVTLSDVVSASADFARLGYNIGDASTLADVATIYKNVGDGIESIDEASQSIIATMQAFGLGAEDAMSIVDKFNEVGNRYAISAKGVGDALLRSAAAMKAAGNTLDETIALTAEANTIVQDPEKVGTTLKVISMYLRAAKTEAEDAGESTDGMANSVSELRSEILKLTGNAVDIQKNNSTFKSTYEILKELAGVWKNLSDISQANILELIGGKRNANVAAAFLENFDIAEKAMKTSAESAGSAVAENEKYLDSAQGKINLMKAAFEDFSRTVVNSNTIKFFVDLGTAILNIANAFTQMTQGFSAIENVIMGITSIASFKNLGLFRTIGTDKEGIANRLGIFRSSFADISSALKSGGVKGAFNEIMSTTAITKSDVEVLRKYDSIVKSTTINISELKKVMSSGSKTAQQMMQAANGVVIGETKIQEAASRTTGSLIRQKVATIGLKLASVALNVGLTMLVSGAINLVIDAFQNWQRQQQETIDKTYEAAKSLDEETSSIEDYKKKILELRTALDDNNISQSAAQSKREELMTIQDELIDKYGKEKDSINNITDAINGQIDALDKLSEKKVEDWGKQNSEGMSSAEKYWTEDITDYITTNNDQYLYSLFANGKQRQKISKSTGIDIGENITSRYQGVELKNYTIKSSNRKDLIDKLNKLYDEVQNYGKTEYNLSDEEISNILTDISNTINYYNDQNAEDGNYNKQKLNAEKSALYKIFTVKNDNGDLKYKPFYDNLNQAIEQYKKALETKDYKQIQEAKQAYEEAFRQIADNTGEGKAIDDTTETGENIKIYLNSIEDEIQSIVDNNEFYIKVDPDKIKTIIAKSSKGSEKRTINAIDLTTMFKADVDKNGVLSEEENKQLGYSKTFVTAYNEIAKAAEDAGISIDSFIKSLEKEGFVASNIGSQSKAITNVFTTYSDEISSITSQADKLKSAYSNLLKGDLSKPDVISLVQDFPKLATYVDLADSNFGNLAQGIQDISGGIADSLIQKLNDIDKSMLTEDELKAYNLLVEYLKNIGIQAQKSLIWLQKIQSTISSVSSSLSSAYSMLNEITDENGNGMLSLSSIDTILTNDAFTSLRPYIDDMDKMQEALKDLMETQKDAYESLANQDLYESDYDKFKSEVDKKAESNSSFISDTIEEINDGISKIESTYKVDLTNWNNLSEDKKTLLANTNAELLVKQRGIIDKFKNTYNIDLTNYKNLEAAKTAIKAAAETQKRNELLETARLEAENKYTQSQLNDPLFGDIYRNSKANFLYWSTNSNNAKKQVKQAGEEALKEAYSIFNAITIPDTDWSKILEGNGSKNKNSKQEFSKQFDWIEVAINKIKKVVSDLSSKVSNTYSNWSSRNSSLKKEIQSVSKEIDVQRNAYAAYIRQANSVGLSSYWKNRVQNGTMDISTIKDERLAEQISSYQELYNKAMDCQDAIQELKQTMSSLYETSFNNVKSEFESKLNILENQINQYNDKITMIETNGYLKTAKYYNELYNDTNNKITTLQSEYKSLTTQLNNAVNSGQIDKYSESWYSMNSQILDVEDSISKANIQLSEFSKTMRQIGWDNFDYLQEQISQISNESNFLIDLMSNDKLYTDKGQFNKLGMATLGLRGQNYNVYMSQADQYKKELDTINKELSKDKYNTDLIDRREKLLSLQQESIKAAEDEKNAIVDLVKNGIQAELDSLKELIDKYNDALDSAKNLYDYQNNISDKTSEIASLRKQLLAYSNDTSEETKATIQKLQVSLSDAEKDLKETEYDKYISDQKELLDNLYSDYEEILNKRLDNVDALVNDMIGVINNNSNSISQTIKSEANSVGYHITANMQNIWNGSTNSVNGTISKYGNKFTEQLTAVNDVLNSIKSYVSGITSAGNSSSATNPKSNYSSITSTNTNSNSNAKKITIGSKVSGKGIQLYGDYNGKNPNRQIHADDPIYIVTGEDNGYYRVRWYKSAQSVTSGWFKKSDVKAYKTGGLVDYTGLAQLDGTPQNPEIVLNSKDTKNFIALKDAMNAITNGGTSLYDLFKGNYNSEVLKQLSKVNSPFTTKETSIGNITYNINIPIDHVQDFNDFMNQMRKDSKFEKMIQSMTVDRLSGKSGLAKNKYEWK